MKRFDLVLQIGVQSAMTIELEEGQMPRVSFDSDDINQQRLSAVFRLPDEYSKEDIDMIKAVAAHALLFSAAQHAEDQAREVLGKPARPEVESDWPTPKGQA